MAIMDILPFIPMPRNVRIPNELIWEVVQFLDLNEREKCMLVNHTWINLIHWIQSKISVDKDARRRVHIIEITYRPSIYITFTIRGLNERVKVVRYSPEFDGTYISEDGLELATNIPCTVKLLGESITHRLIIHRSEFLEPEDFHGYQERKPFRKLCKKLGKALQGRCLKYMEYIQWPVIYELDFEEKLKYWNFIEDCGSRSEIKDMEFYKESELLREMARNKNEGYNNGSHLVANIKYD